MLFEDGMQIVLYSIVGAANAGSGQSTGAQLAFAFVAGGQSFIYFLIKGYELTKDSEGKGGAGLSRTSSRTGSPSRGSLQSGKASIRNHL